MANLKQGSSGSDVKKLQTALMNAGYDVGTAGADGIFGSKTEAAVKAYQKDNGLVVDGIVGSKTSGSLYGSSNTGNSLNIKGVNQDLADKAYNSSFVASDDVNAAKNKKDEIGAKVESMANQTDIIDQKTMDTINSRFSGSSLYEEAYSYTQSLLAKLSSGRTSYTDKVEAMMDKIMNREDFEYDVDSDQLFQQALASAMNSGKSAMQDTIGQASALTGGYGSTYATSAGNQAYNAFIEDAYNNLPEYYQMALQAYQMEGEEMFKELGMYVDADNREYQRTYDAWSANHANTESIYNREYGQWKDTVDNAYKSANLQLQEHSIGFDKLSTVYDIYRDEENTLYNREYQSWADEVSQAQQAARLLNNDAWRQTEFDEGVRQYNEKMEYQKGRDAVADSQWEKQYALDEKYTNAQIAKMNSSGSGGGSGGSGKTSTLTDSQLKTAQELYIKAGGGDAGLAEVDGYLSAIGKNNLSEEGASYLMSTLNGSTIPSWYQNWTITKDTKNWLGGDDNNDKYSNGTTTKTFKELKKEIENSGLKKDEQEKILNKIKSQSKK